MTGNVREMRRVETRSDLRSRIELASSLLANRSYCLRCDPSLDLIRLALAGISPEESQNENAEGV